MMKTKVKTGIIILVIGIILISGCVEQLEVTITTDKIEYEQGEVMKITIKNNLGKSIWYGGGPGFTCLNAFSMGVKENESYNEFFPLGMAWCMSSTVELKPRSEQVFDLELNDRFTSWLRAGNVKLPVTCKLKFNYGFSKKNSKEKVYSNEFTIRERSKQDVTITTDKTEYEQEEKITLSTTNNLKEPIFLPGCNHYVVEKKDKGEWKESSPYIRRCAWEGLALKIDVSKTEIFDLFAFESGFYRVKLFYGVGCEEGKPLSQARCKGNSTIYSNEFTIVDTTQPLSGQPDPCKDIPPETFHVLHTLIPSTKRSPWETIEDYSERDRCYLNLALEKEDESICEKIVGVGRSGDCYTQIAKIKKNGDICNLIRYSNQKNTCYEIVAKEKHDPRICDRIDDNKFRDRCYVVATTSTTITATTSTTITITIPEKGVSITTDKTKYKAGEKVKIVMRNNLNRSIWYYGYKEKNWFKSSGCFRPTLLGSIKIQKYNGEWKNIRLYRGPSLAYIAAHHDCYWPELPEPSLMELKQSGNITLIWNQRILDLKTPESLDTICSCEEGDILYELGKYRMSFEYYLSNETKELKYVYSNEFVIS